VNGCGDESAEELNLQLDFLQALDTLSVQVKQFSGSTKQKSEFLKWELRKVRFESKVKIPLNPAMQVKDFIIEDCK
jgi:hypothetical protein